MCVCVCVWGGGGGGNNLLAGGSDWPDADAQVDQGFCCSHVVYLQALSLHDISRLFNANPEWPMHLHTLKPDS